MELTLVIPDDIWDVITDYAKANSREPIKNDETDDDFRQRLFADVLYKRVRIMMRENERLKAEKTLINGKKGILTDETRSEVLTRINIAIANGQLKAIFK